MLKIIQEILDNLKIISDHYREERVLKQLKSELFLEHVNLNKDINITKIHQYISYHDKEEIPLIMFNLINFYASREDWRCSEKEKPLQDLAIKIIAIETIGYQEYLKLKLAS
jgi:hypothetical protein